MDETTLKFRELFFAEIESTAADGLGHPAVYWLIWRISERWTTNTQEVEGLNNTVKMVGKLAPFISWQLLSSRVVSKKDLRMHCHDKASR